MAIGTETRRILRLACWIAVAVAVAYFAVRGIWRGAIASADLAVGYGAGSAWLQGLDPYAAEVLKAEVARRGAEPIVVNTLDVNLNVYFPPTITSFTPLAPFEWTLAKGLFLVLNVASTAFILWGLLRLLGWDLRRTRSLLLMAFVLALAPVHTTIASGQGAILATAMVIAGALLERARPARARWAGAAYGLAVILKVQIGLPFIAYAIWRRRWETSLVAIGIAAATTLVAVVRMVVAGVPWFASWTDNLRALSGSGGINDPSAANPDRYSLINLQYLLESFGVTGLAADLITYGAVGIAAVALVTLVRGRDPDRGLLILSGVAVLCLLVTYHRYYDAVLLAIPIAWGVSILRTSRALGVVTLVLCANFLLPVQTALHDLVDRGVVPSLLSANPLWDTVVMTQHVWALLFLVGVILVAARSRSAVSGTASPVVPAAG